MEEHWNEKQYEGYFAKTKSCKVVAGSIVNMPEVLEMQAPVLHQKRKRYCQHQLDSQDHFFGGHILQKRQQMLQVSSCGLPVHETNGI